MGDGRQHRGDGGYSDAEACEQSEVPEQNAQRRSYSNSLRLDVILGPNRNITSHYNVDSRRSLGEAYWGLADDAHFCRDIYMPDQGDNPYWSSYLNFIKDSRTQSDTLKFNPDCLDEVSQADFGHLKTRYSIMKGVGDSGQASYNTNVFKLQQAHAAAARQVGRDHRQLQEMIRDYFQNTSAEDSGNAAKYWTLADHTTTLSGALLEASKLSDLSTAIGVWMPRVVTLSNTLINLNKDNPATQGTPLAAATSFANVVSFGGAINSLWLNPGHITTSYIGPLLNEVLAQFGNLQAGLRTVNDASVNELGYPTYLNPEIGGADMWNYMVDAINATSAAQIPPPTGSVYKYFDSNRQRFDIFVKADINNTSPRPMPHDNDILTPVDVDPEAFPAWLFRERERVWVLLYGSRDPKKAKRAPSR